MVRPVPSGIEELAVPPKWQASPLPLLGRFFRRGRQYAGLVFWLLNKAFRGEARTLAVVTALSVLYLAGQAAALYTIYWYGMRIQGDPTAIAYGLGDILPTEENSLLLSLVVVITASSLILSAICLYFSRTAVFRIVEKDFKNGLEYIANMGVRLPDPRAPLASRLLMEHKRSGLASGCRRGALTAIAFSQSISPMVAGAGAVGLLLLIDVWLTLAIALAGIVWATLLYPITLRAVSFALRREKAQADYRREAELLPRLELTDQAFKPMESPPELASAYVGRHRVMNEMGLITEIGATAIVALAILYMAGQVMAGAENWAIFIAYVGALRLTLAGGFQGVRAFASVSRFYPMIVRYFDFMKDLRDIDQLSVGQVTRGDPVSLGSLPDGSDVIVEAGNRLAVLAASMPVSALQLAFLGAHARETRLPLDISLICSDDPACLAQCTASLAIVEARKLRKLRKLCKAEQTTLNLDQVLKDKVTLVTHADPSEVGRFGECHLLAVEDGALMQFVPFGTPESWDLLEAFASRAGRKPLSSESEDEDDGEDEDLL